MTQIEIAFKYLLLKCMKFELEIYFNYVSNNNNKIEENACKIKLIIFCDVEHCFPTFTVQKIYVKIILLCGHTCHIHFNTFGCNLTVTRAIIQQGLHSIG